MVFQDDIGKLWSVLRKMKESECVAAAPEQSGAGHGLSVVTRLLLCEAEGHDQHHHSSVDTAPKKSTVGRSLVHCALRV